MRKALENAARLYKSARVLWLQAWLERVNRMPGAPHLFQRMAFAPAKSQFDDYLAEARYALVFAGLGFNVTIVEPSGGKGPDLEVCRDGHRAHVEITRFRRLYPGPRAIDLSDNEDAELLEYGNPHRDIKRSHRKLNSKLSQLGNPPSIIALWNDDGDLEEWEVEAAVVQLRRSFAQCELTVPTGLSFVIYGSEWVRAGDHKQLYCIPVRSSAEPHQMLWQQELDGSTVRGLVARALGHAQ